ncbi:glycosylhydrolase-like jelly roll fold domain-containing protein [Cohnella sp.]|uniref:glycosylhydrolase-like jelly roll fold domain-containing protein n=1 Tax=Cohnella sp. TaxID=1883426 RepID=UPI003703B0A0
MSGNIQLQELLRGEERNYILPFLWQRGEEEAVIREELARIREAGIRAVCVESRPHPDMLGPKWWRDMDIIMDEARTHGMQIWVFDDDHFPTGHAAGKVKEAPLEHQRQFLSERRIDARGPDPEASFLLRPWSVLDGARPVGAAAARRDPATGKLDGEFLPIDLETSVQDGVLYWPVPEGFWTICLFVVTREGGDDRRKDYLNPIVPESTQILIDTIYEAYYARYKDDFGATFAGFFSDEPGFYNSKASYDYASGLGNAKMALPWRDDLLELLEAEYGPTVRQHLPLMWHEGGPHTFAMRYAYMNVVSKLYAEHFSGRIGRWCQERGVAYIGHLMEDNNVHARLGCGAGHFFRALQGQDMSGLDVVLWQIVPGFDEMSFSWMGGETDSVFFHYGMTKLAASLGHLDPRKRGRTFCEIFGAYGWAEGLKLMKWLTDHMLVRGVNHFVPHAFSQKEFPDWDCPPHFYARGYNPQFRHYGLLNAYTNRLCHLLNDGQHVATAGVLYHAEAEWSGEAMLFQEPVKQLMQNQIDCDVLPADVLLRSSVMEGELAVHEERYRCLIVPYAEALPIELIAKLSELAESGLRVVFVDSLPKRASQVVPYAEPLRRLEDQAKISVVPLLHLADALRDWGMYELETSDRQPYLRTYQYRHDRLEVVMLFNEHPEETLNTRVILPGEGAWLRYDAFGNTLGRVGEGRHYTYDLTLSAYESAVLLRIPPDDEDKYPVRKGKTAPTLEATSRLIEPTEWRVSLATAQDYPEFKLWGTLTSLRNLGSRELLPRFSGTMKYECQVQDEEAADSVWLDLGRAYETAQVWVNGREAGVRLCAPYVWDISELWRQGTNELTVEVTNTLAKDQQDWFSKFVQQEPSGLLGPVRLLRQSAISAESGN